MIHTEGLVEAITRTQAVVHFTPDGVVTDANELFLKTMGYDHKEVVGSHHRIFMDSKAAERPEYAQFWATLRDGTKQQGEFKRRHKSGADVWLSATYTPILKDGKVTSIVKLGRDITSEKLRSVEMETQVSAINRTQAVVAFDVEGKILHANDIFLRTMGYSLDEVVGKPHRMFMPEVLPPDYQAFWEDLRAGQSKNGEFKRFGKGGRQIYLQAVYTPMVLDGKVVKVIKFAQDVTKEKMRTKDFECQIEAIRQTQAVVTFAPDATVIEANDLFLETMGYELKDVVGRHHRLFVTPADAAKPEYAEFWEAMREGTGFAQGEFKRIAKGGRVVWLNATYTPIVIDDKVVKIVKYAQDITEEKLKK